MLISKIDQCSQPAHGPSEVLPLEMLTRIFLLIHQNPDALNNFSYVCKQWYIVKLQNSFSDEQFLINKFLEAYNLQNKFLEEQAVLDDEAVNKFAELSKEAHATIDNLQNYLNKLITSHQSFSLQTADLSFKSISTELKSHLLSIYSVIDKHVGTAIVDSKYKIVANYSMMLRNIFPELSSELSGVQLGQIMASHLASPSFTILVTLNGGLWATIDSMLDQLKIQMTEHQYEILRFHALLELEKEDSLKSDAQKKLAELTENAALTDEQLLVLYAKNCLPIDSCIAASKNGLFSVLQRRNMAATYIKSGEDLGKVISLINTIPEDADNTRSTVLCQLIKKLSGNSKDFLVIRKLLLAIPNVAIKAAMKKKYPF